MRTLFLLCGISATGKGTRVSTLIEFLKTLDSDYQSFFVSKIGLQTVKKPFQIALHFPKFNTTFMGKWLKSNKTGRMISWSSLDGFSSYKENYFDIPNLTPQSHFICEGHFGSFFFKPDRAAQCGFRKQVVDHFLYRDKQEYRDRCLGRSASQIKEDSSPYQRNAQFLDETKRDRYYAKWANLAAQNNVEFSVATHWCDTLPVYWGCKVLSEIGLRDSKLDFMNFCETNTTYRHVDSAQANIDRFSKYLGGDTENIRLVELPTVKTEELEQNSPRLLDSSEG